MEVTFLPSILTRPADSCLGTPSFQHSPNMWGHFLKDAAHDLMIRSQALTWGVYSCPCTNVWHNFKTGLLPLLLKPFLSVKLNMDMPPIIMEKCSLWMGGTFIKIHQNSIFTLQFLQLQHWLELFHPYGFTSRDTLLPVLPLISGSWVYM